MRFIDVTRYGGVKTLRLSVAAIAYVDACDGGAVIRLLGGESLRVNEDPATIEARATEETLAITLAGEPDATFDALPPFDGTDTGLKVSAPRKGKRK